MARKKVVRHSSKRTRSNKKRKWYTDLQIKTPEQLIKALDRFI